MADDISVLEHLYERFNARDIDGVLAFLADDVAWANGMDGGHVHGKPAVRDYWERQWTIVSPHVKPVGFRRAGESTIVADVEQSVRDLEGNPIVEAEHGLRDKIVGHIFSLRDGKVTRFDIEGS